MLGRSLIFLDLHHLLPLAGLVLLLLLLELELAVVQDLADGRIRVGHNLHQIQTHFLGRLERGTGGHDPLLFAVLVDQQDAGDADFVIDTRTVFDGRRLHGAANRQCSWSRCAEAAAREPRRPTAGNMTKRPPRIKARRRSHP